MKWGWQCQREGCTVYWAIFWWPVIKYNFLQLWQIYWFTSSVPVSHTRILPYLDNFTPNGYTFVVDTLKQKRESLEFQFNVHHMVNRPCGEKAIKTQTEHENFWQCRIVPGNVMLQFVFSQDGCFRPPFPFTKLPVYSLVPNWLITMPIHSRKGGPLSGRSCNIHLLFFDAHRGPVSAIRQILLESDRCYPIYVTGPKPLASSLCFSSVAISCRQAYTDLTLFVGCLYQILMFRNAFWQLHRCMA